MASSMFFMIFILQSTVAVACGFTIMFYLQENSMLGHGVETARKLAGSTPHDQLRIQISNSFAGLLLLAIVFLVFMVAFMKDKEFQSFATGCTLLHLAMALWRFCFERRVEDLVWDWPKQAVGDFVLALSRLFFFFLVYTWREKYD